MAIAKRRIILASGSKARRELLRQAGLDFIVAHSKVRERRVLKKGCKDLVVENAVKKARSVARRFNKGIVIAADTVVLSGRKIIGKPRSKKDAFRTIRNISRKPQWVFSGIAVVDIEKKRCYSAYEKTKIFMYPLSDEQIRRYINKVDTLDKAGSFDIQGLGALFIERIEGCYFNVVGLPLAKLARILERIGAGPF